MEYYKERLKSRIRAGTKNASGKKEERLAGRAEVVDRQATSTDRFDLVDRSFDKDRFHTVWATVVKLGNRWDNAAADQGNF